MLLLLRFFFKIQKVVTFYVFCRVSYVFSNYVRRGLIEVELQSNHRLRLRADNATSMIPFVPLSQSLGKSICVLKQ